MILWGVVSSFPLINLDEYGIGSHRLRKRVETLLIHTVAYFFLNALIALQFAVKDYVKEVNLL